MTDVEKDEEIIELTEVVEEEPASDERDRTGLFAPSTPELKIAEPSIDLQREPDREPRKDGSREPGGGLVIPDSPLKGILLSDKEKEKGRKIGEGQGISLPIPEPSRSLSPDFEVELRALREALTAKAEAWMASEGVRVLERVAREIFPQIAEGVLRREVERLKAEVKEKE
jgi:hypothetical protein